MMDKLTIDEIIGHCERKTEQYERLFGKERLETTPLISSTIKEYWEHRQVAEYLRKLKEYQQLEEQGRLIKLHYKDVYFIVDINNPRYAAVMKRPIRELAIYEIESIDKKTASIFPQKKKPRQN
jgi:hypothetical protein